jgi:hypothetical protein
VIRKSTKPRPRPAKTEGADPATVSVLPMDIHIGDRFPDEEGEWGVVSHPTTLPRRQEPAGAGSTDGTASGRARRDVAGSRQSRDSAGSHTVSTHDMRFLPYLLPWVRVLFLIRSITSTDWDDTTGRLVQPILRRALEMRRQIAREGWWN